MGLGGSKRAKRSPSTSKNSLTTLDDTELQDGRPILDYHEQILLEVEEGEKDRGSGLGVLQVLPDECILRILSFLPLKDIGEVSCASKTLFVLGRDDFLWKTFYTNMGIQKLFEDCIDNVAEKRDFGRANGTKKKKNKRQGKWRTICLKNLLCLRDGEPIILNEQILGITYERVEELFGQCDEVTNVGRGSAYYFYHSVGLSICCEDAKISCVLKHIPLESCTGAAYEKIVPLPF